MRVGSCNEGQASGLVKMSSESQRWEGVEGIVGYRDAGEWMHGCRAGTSGWPAHCQLLPPIPHLSLLLRAFTSRPMASLLSVASSSSRCSFLRLALMRWDSSSASSSCLFSCLTLVFPFSACQGKDSGSARLYMWGPKALGKAKTVRKGQQLWLPAPCTVLPSCAHPPPAAGPPSASCPFASVTW